MPKAPAIIRPAMTDDALGYANVHHTAWAETYSGLLPESHWEADTIERRTATWERWLERRAAVSVAKVAGQMVGIALGSRAKDR